ncbi:hypothetical protein SAMN05421837_102587 [Amycolatopsis pretoriensis]|uniref:UDP-glucuronosyltransferase n=1 Tax=Amycolatopsis pretoriensis TaxID=218821 RepID=A0A1H5QDK4_9PSEU|nr:hypothetical protein [Amycolatopsis pretoriensis]SEF24146.1 hypothetical protein SAMN05421837_102587 [Amycolatopsis pretoriensis]
MIEILTSGVALGVHVPGLLLADRLREKGCRAEVNVIERLLPAAKRATAADMKWAFHRDFRLAKTGHRIATDPAEVADDGAVRELMAKWAADGVRTFVVWSGFWLPIVRRYLSTQDASVRVVVCHIDSQASPSFRKAGAADVPAEHVFMIDAARRSVPCSVPVSPLPPVAWADRERLYAHGGGWGMGTYREPVDDLAAHGFELDVLAYEAGDVAGRPGARYFMMDPAWHPWHDDGYPPFGEVRRDGTVRYTRGVGCPGSFELTRSAMAMVSKPGGGTLLDSLWAATPVVLLEPLGAAERANAGLWQELGFGVPYEDWRATGYSPGVLEALHRNLVRALPDVPDYSSVLAAA